MADAVNPAFESAPARSVAGIARRGAAFFVARRVAGGDLGGKWEFPGGKVEDGESDAAALIREYREEFGVAIRVGSLLASDHFEHHQRRRILSAYEVFFDGDGFSLREHTAWRWAPLDEIAALDFADSDRKLLPQLDEKQKTSS
jgi:8-oxo-dGTP diphosphatase